MDIVTWNVAGLRACEKKGFYDWYLKDCPDVLCLQETKALPEQLSAQLVNPKFHEAIYAPAEKKGYSGVSTWVKKNLNCEHTIGLGEKKFDSEGRTIISEFDKFILFNCYFPNGSRDHSRVPYKLEFYELVSEKAKTLKKQKKKSIVITGDFNTAHREIDLANPKANIKTTGFLPEERAWLDRYQNEGLADVFRHFIPKENGHYTWWTFRNDCRARNIGWRLDGFWCSKEFLGQVSSCLHLTEVLGSDHCPVKIEID